MSKIIIKFITTGEHEINVRQVKAYDFDREELADTEDMLCS